MQENKEIYLLGASIPASVEPSSNGSCSAMLQTPSLADSTVLNRQNKYFLSMTFFFNFNQNAFFLIQLQCITVHKYIFEWQSHDILGHTVFMNSYTFVNILILFISQQALHFWRTLSTLCYLVLLSAALQCKIYLDMINY